MEIRLRHNLWGNRKGIRLNLSDSWRISVLNMAGDKKPLLKRDEIRASVLSLAPLVKNKKEVCVAFDDLSRPTKAFKIVPFLIELFEKSGIRDEQVRFICGLGTHAALD
ncbi:MAG: nickel-dependent lactate racemase, partial [Syntrophorhabdaceae bacterium]|nr:nickel-dependent lactate racemase [Syntrophorhabdaceae bacterium]